MTFDYMPWWGDRTKKFADEVENFMDTELQPRAIKLLEQNKDPMTIQWEASKLCIDKGFHPLMVLAEEEYGGVDQGYAGYTILNEEVGRAMININPLLTSVFGAGPIHLFGTEQQKQKYMVPLVKGEKWASITVTEPDVGNDAAGIQLSAEKDGDEWVLNGWKRYITLGAISDYHMLYANSDPEMRRVYRHLTAFFVPTNLPGISIEKINSLIGDVEMANSVIRYRDVRVPEENMILDPGDGWTVMTSALNIERLGIAGVVGSSRNLLETARAYGRRRVQFGMPISRYNGVQLRMANISMKMHLTRVFLYYLADLLDKGEADMFSFGVKSSISKVFGTQSLTEMALDALFICGGDGYLQETGVGGILKNAALMQIAGGSNDILKLFIGRNEFMQEVDTRMLTPSVRGPTEEDAKNL
ncbi:MAG: acyl-CoA dehydrogenase family protein [Candidatus Hermodarchaeota archaeon]